MSNVYSWKIILFTVVLGSSVGCFNKKKIKTKKNDVSAANIKNVVNTSEKLLSDLDAEKASYNLQLQDFDKLLAEKVELTKELNKFEGRLQLDNVTDMAENENVISAIHRYSTKLKRLDTKIKDKRYQARLNIERLVVADGKYKKSLVSKSKYDYDATMERYNLLIKEAEENILTLKSEEKLRQELSDLNKEDVKEFADSGKENKDRAKKISEIENKLAYIEKTRNEKLETDSKDFSRTVSRVRRGTRDLMQKNKSINVMIPEFKEPNYIKRTNTPKVYGLKSLPKLSLNDENAKELIDKETIKLVAMYEENKKLLVIANNSKSDIPDKLAVIGKQLYSANNALIAAKKNNASADEINQLEVQKNRLSSTAEGLGQTNKHLSDYAKVLEKAIHINLNDLERLSVVSNFINNRLRVNSLINKITSEVVNKKDLPSVDRDDAKVEIAKLKSFLAHYQKSINEGGPTVFFEKFMTKNVDRVPNSLKSKKLKK